MSRATVRRPRRTPTTLRSGCILLAVAGLLLYMAFVHAVPLVPKSTPATVSANFASAANVNTATPVRIGGITIGTVSRVIPADGGRTSIVEMAIGSRAHSIHADATATIRMRTFVSGSMYIDLNPGSSSAPLLGGRVIGLSATSTQVDWDQFNSINQAAVRRGQQLDIKGFAQTLGAPAGIRQTLSVFPGALYDAGIASDASRGLVRGDLPELIRTTGQTLAALSADGHSLGDFIDGAQRTFAAINDRSQAFSATLADTPAALRSSLVTMDQLQTTLDRLGPLAVALEPGAKKLGPAMAVMHPALIATDGLLTRMSPLLSQVRPALHALATASREGSPFLHAIQPVIDRLNGQLLPFLATPYTPSGMALYEAIGPSVAALDSADSGFDDNGYFLRDDAKESGEASVIGPCNFGYANQNLQACTALLESYFGIGGPPHGRLSGMSAHPSFYRRSR
jgi:ABC-type transporter Mla subunit MlaD